MQRDNPIGVHQREGTACACARREVLFSNPIVYHLIVDRFCPDGAWAARDVGGPDFDFHGGSFRGVVARIREGWFTSLGINTLLISSPVEQIAGWIPDADGARKHHAYHGYWPLDFTVVDRRLGTEEEFDELVAAAHYHGLNVVLDLVLGHVGYQDLQTVATYRPACVSPGWQAATPADYPAYWSDDSHANAVWGNWIDTARVSARTNRLPQLALDRHVDDLPVHLREKSVTRAVSREKATVSDYMIEWAAGWVHARGIDGFRCDSAAHLPMAIWQRLKNAATATQEHAAGCTACARPCPFWMTGEVYGHGIEMDAYFNHGFDSLINFDFQPALAGIMFLRVHANEFSGEVYHRRLDKLYARYADRIRHASQASMLSYISSHDTMLFDRRHLRDAMTALLLAPGGVLVFYGDECGRAPGAAPASDPAQATRSPLDWNAIDTDMLRHVRLLGRFRARHACIAQGAHHQLDIHPYAFARLLEQDAVVVVLGTPGAARIRVGQVFEEGMGVVDAYTGLRMQVVDGCVAGYFEDIVLLEPAWSAA